MAGHILCSRYTAVLHIFYREAAPAKPRDDAHAQLLPRTRVFTVPFTTEYHFVSVARADEEDQT